MENIALDGVFNKNLPKDIRGTLNSGYSFFGGIGLLCFTKLGGYLYDNVSPNSPFVFVGICDVAFAFLVILLKLCGKFNQ
jgi:MFS family permease